MDRELDRELERVFRVARNRILDETDLGKNPGEFVVVDEILAECRTNVELRVAELERRIRELELGKADEVYWKRNVFE